MGRATSLCYSAEHDALSRQIKPAAASSNTATRGRSRIVSRPRDLLILDCPLRKGANFRNLLVSYRHTIALATSAETRRSNPVKLRACANPTLSSGHPLPGGRTPHPRVPASAQTAPQRAARSSWRSEATRGVTPTGPHGQSPGAHASGSLRVIPVQQIPEIGMWRARRG